MSYFLIYFILYLQQCHWYRSDAKCDFCLAQGGGRIEYNNNIVCVISCILYGIINETRVLWFNDTIGSFLWENLALNAPSPLVVSIKKTNNGWESRWHLSEISLVKHGWAALIRQNLKSSSIM